MSLAFIIVSKELDAVALVSDTRINDAMAGTPLSDDVKKIECVAKGKLYAVAIATMDGSRASIANLKKNYKDELTGEEIIDILEKGVNRGWAELPLMLPSGTDLSDPRIKIVVLLGGKDAEDRVLGAAMLRSSFVEDPPIVIYNDNGGPLDYFAVGSKNEPAVKNIFEKKLQSELLRPYRINEIAKLAQDTIVETAKRIDSAVGPEEPDVQIVLGSSHAK